MDFALLVLVTAILRIRPTDLIPGFEAAPVYEVAILSCLLFALGQVASELTAIFSGKRPIAVFMLGILVLIPVSDAIQGQIELGFDVAIEYLKVIVYFVLLVGIVNTPGRLRWFIVWLVLIDLVPTCLALLHFHGQIYIPAYQSEKSGFTSEFDPETGTDKVVPRLIGSGMFGDPNDFCQILNTGLMFCVGGLMEKAAVLTRFIWLVPIASFSFAVWKTGSRGGLLGTLGGLAVLFWTRFGRRKALLAALLVAPLFLFLVSGRMAQLSASEGTGRTRVEIWEDVFLAWRHSPIIVGIGAARCEEIVGRAAHNGFLCAFAELGFVGGMLFFGAFYYAIVNLWRLGVPDFVIEDPEVRRLRPYILAAMVGYTINEMSLTHPYAVVTYMMLGLATACIRLADPQFTREEAWLSGKLLLQVTRTSVVFLVALFCFVRFMLHR